MIPIKQLERIDKILDEYNEYLLNLDRLDYEVALNLEDELRGEFIQICDDLTQPELPITPQLANNYD